MTLGARLKQYRMGRRLSQEKVVERLGVSRQAVTKWENDQTMPSAENLLALASLYEVPMEELVGNYLHQRKDRTILRTNLTILAILWQAATLNVCIYITPDAFPMSLGGLLLFKWIPLAASTLWMAHRLHDEKNPKQYWKNVKIESLYCAASICNLSGCILQRLSHGGNSSAVGCVPALPLRDQSPIHESNVG